MESPSIKKSLSQCMIESRNQRIENAINKLNEIDEWLLDMPFNHPDYQNKVLERNHLIRITN